MPSVLELEFTVEPFVDGAPGRHVIAAVQAVESAGLMVVFGPFGSSCTATDDEMPGVIAAMTEAAFAHGATNVAMNVRLLDDELDGGLGDDLEALGSVAGRGPGAAGRQAPDATPRTGREAPPPPGSEVADTGEVTQ